MENTSRLDSGVILSSMSLPLGELGSRSAEDERAARGFSQKGDLSAEGQAVLSDELTAHEGPNVRKTRSGWFGPGCPLPRKTAEDSLP